MSIEIFYGRNFIKIDESRVIPLYLSGSSNCTEFVGGREVYERRWGYHPFEFITTLDGINEVLDKFDDPYGEWFARGSRSGNWMSKEQFRTVCKNAFKDAHTVEEFAESYQPIHLVAWKHGEVWERKMDRYVRTTQELLDWYEEYKNTYQKDGFNISCNLGSREQVKFKNLTASKFPCVLKSGKMYLISDTNRDGKYNTWCSDKAQAIIFNNQEEIDNLKDKIVHWGQKAIRTESATIVEKPYAIYCDFGGYGHYFKRLSSRHIFWGTEKSCKRFTTEKEALRYADKIFLSSIKEKKVVRIEG